MKIVGAIENCGRHGHCRSHIMGGFLR